MLRQTQLFVTATLGGKKAKRPVPRRTSVPATTGIVNKHGEQMVTSRGGTLWSGRHFNGFMGDAK